MHRVRVLVAALLPAAGVVLLLWAGTSLLATTRTDDGDICGKTFRAVWFPESVITGGELSEEARAQARSECRAEGERILDIGTKRALGGAAALAIGGVAFFAPWPLRREAAAESSEVSR